MEMKQTATVHVAHPTVEIQVLYAAGVKRRTAAYDAVYLISFFN